MAKRKAKRAHKAAPACSTKSCSCGCGGKIGLGLLGALLSALGLLLLVAGVLAQVKMSVSLWWVYGKYVLGLILMMVGAKCKHKVFCH